MRLTRLCLTGFRNLTDAPLPVPAEGVAVVGRNAQGKTNLLEAIHYLETFRSFRRARDEDLVSFGSAFFRLEAAVEEESGEPREIAAAFQRSPQKKKVLLDGEEVLRLGDAIGSLATVLFTPDDLRLVRGGPSERRRFLDVSLSLNEPGYLRSLQTFRHALAQRNAALRDRAGSAAAFAWDPVLVRSGTAISLSRAQWVREFSAAFEMHHAEISGGTSAQMGYRPSVPGASEIASHEEVEERYREALASSRSQESSRRMTIVGPHRDELTFSAAESTGRRDLREYGSGGEQRTVALTLRLLELETARARRGREPILLLDDVFAELDEERTRRVLELLDSLASGQVVLTAPKEADVRFRGDSLAKWRIEGGEIGW